ncbi:MAG: flagellar hook-length control protein FliK [Kiritimatiellae bacterium]|nr:flagellar hook-length control protein FliK [Kiritimatiellia bacterium]
MSAQVTRPIVPVEGRKDEDLESPAARIQAVPVAVTPPVAEAVVPLAPEVAAASAATARTEAIVETAERIVEAVAGQIVVTPALTQGEGNVRITLKPTVLDGSEISLTAQDGTLAIAIVPATPEAERLAAAALPRLETALAEHVPAFSHVSVAIGQKKGRSNETA